MKRELTLSNGKKVIVNFDLVTDVSEGGKGEAIITFSENYFFSVKETYADVGTEFLNG